MRYPTPYTPIEFQDGDLRFNAIDMTRDRSLLPPGTLAIGQNCRLRTGRAAQRAGTSVPPDFNPATPERYVGSGTYRNPNGDEIMLLAPAEQTYAIAVQYGKDSYHINYSAAEIARGGNNGVNRLVFAQAFDKVELIRSPAIIGTPPMLFLTWDGTGDLNNDGVADTNFEIIALSATGRQLVPPTWDAEPVYDRVIYYNSNYYGKLGRDYWIMSDIGDYTSFDPVYQIGRTNSGEADYITRVKAYFRGSFIVYKNHSIYEVTIIPNIYPVQFEQRLLSSRVGSVGRLMPLSVGGDEIFLSEPGGFYRLSEVIQDQIVTLPKAVSEPIQPYIDSINWIVTKVWGCSVSIDNYALFGVAVGVGATRCNQILVFNTQTNGWESVPDTWSSPTFGFNALHVTNYNGEQRVFAVDYDNAIVYLLYDGLFDQMKDQSWFTPFKVGTRGYVGSDPFSFKRILRTSVSIATVNPSVVITAITDGVNEEKNLTPIPITKSQLALYTHGKTFNPATDDPNEPYREDYAITQPIPPPDPKAAIEDFEDLPVGTILQLPATDIVQFLQGPQTQKQQSTERRLARVTGRWVALDIENKQGICEVIATSIEGTQSGNNIRTAA